MELFFSDDICGSTVRLDAEESVHCVKVLRHRAGDTVFIIDGRGTLLECTLTDDSPKGAEARIEKRSAGWGAHGYRLTAAVCPTKNADRYEWFVEKATELGVDSIVPVIGEHSERRVYKTDRLRKLVRSAAKQSLKAAVPVVEEPVGCLGFIESLAGRDCLKLIAYCDEDCARRTSIMEALDSYDGSEIVFLVGPEGDFSADEVRAAMAAGFIPVHLGASRLRTETAAVAATAAVYFNRMEKDNK